MLQAKEKMVLLNVGMHYCHWCKKMQREVFDNPKVLKKLKTKFRVIMMKKGDAKLPAGIKPHFFPTTYVLTSDMKKVDDELPGYMSAKDLLNYFDLLDLK